VLFAALGLFTLTVNLFLPSLKGRRRVAGAFSRWFFGIAGIPLKIEGLDRLPDSPCVVVANHAS
jgi:1-acyl-sn-glycerol-3-phosphate acyltransferase